MRAVLIDAYDSFVFIIRQYLEGLGVQTEVLRSQPGNLERVRGLAPDAVVLGPGPGHPTASGHVELVHELMGEVPLLGVCLGHQAIAVALGATVRPAEHLMHGKTSVLAHDGQGVFRHAPPGQVVTRYHSLIVEEDTVPPELVVTARSLDDGYVMGLRHRSLPVESVQFHPESITTEGGEGILRSFLQAHVDDRDEALA